MSRYTDDISSTFVHFSDTLPIECELIEYHKRFLGMQIEKPLKPKTKKRKGGNEKSN